MVFENIDDRIFVEFCESIFKAHAIATGIGVASYFIQTSELKTDIIVKLQSDLKQGV